MADEQTTPRQDDPSLDPGMFSPRPMAGASPAMMPALPMEPQAGPDQSFIDRQVQGRKELTKETIAKLEPYQRQQFDIGMAGVRHPPQPRLRDIPKAPQDNFRNVFKESMPGLIFTTLLGSVMSKRHGMGAMAAATGYMEGFHTGDKERMDNERQKWRDNVDGLIAQNNVEIERSAAIWRDTSLSMQEKQGKLQALASAEGNALKIDALKRGDMDALYQFDQDRRKATQHMEETQMRWGAGSGDAIISDQAADRRADMIINGNQAEAYAGLGGRGKNREINMKKVDDALDRKNADPRALSIAKANFEGFKAAQRVLSTREAQLGVGTQEMANFAGPALAASKAVSRGNWVPLNEFSQKAKKIASDPALKEFKLRHEALVTGYSQVMQRASVITVFSAQRARELLETADGPTAYETGVRTLMDEAHLAEAAPGQVREMMAKKFGLGAIDMEHGKTTTPSGQPMQPQSLQQAAGGSAPSPGHVQDGYRFKGGDPSKQENWEQVL